MMKQPAGYLFASGRDGTLYIDVASNLVQRVWQHREQLASGFANAHAVCLPRTARGHGSATNREKQIKKWRRAGKLRLIEEGNPSRRDLRQEMVDARDVRLARTSLGTRLRGCDGQDSDTLRNGQDSDALPNGHDSDALRNVHDSDALRNGHDSDALPNGQDSDALPKELLLVPESWRWFAFGHPGVLAE